MSLTIIIIAITGIVSFMAFQNAELFNRFKFNAYYIKRDKEWYRFLSHALLHADWGHLIINMIVLWSFGGVVQSIFSYDFGSIGTIHFLALYIGGALFSTLYDFAKHKDDIYYNAVGASGAVAAVVFASIILYPGGSIYLFFIPIPIPSWLFGILYLVYSAYMGKRAQDNIGHNAHFWGSIFGIVYTLLINPAYIENFLGQLGIN
jgi:membrane associated rhomboid family serine protease